jgi:hypothetical protein
MKALSKMVMSCAVILLLLSACRKNYVCRCTTTITSSSGNTDIINAKGAPFNKKMTKEQAQAVCSHEGENINSMYYNIATNNGTQVTFNTFKTSCSLE